MWGSILGGSVLIGVSEGVFLLSFYFRFFFFLVKGGGN